MSTLPTVEILGVPIARISRERALQEIAELCERQAPALIAYANAHTLNLASRDEGYREVLRNSALVLNDGAGVGLAARLAKTPFPENLNGSDLNPLIVELAATRGWPVYFLGGRDGVAVTAAQRLVGRFPALMIAGTHHGYLDEGALEGVVSGIKTSGARVLLVAMGNPLQELWLERHLAATGACIGIGVGAFFDFTAGTVKRAPAWMNRLGIEWLYRLAQEPRRMWRRYVLGNPLFLARVLRERLRR